MLLAVATVACGSDEQTELGSGVVFIQEVEIVERDGEFVAVVTGRYPDACSTFGAASRKSTVTQ